MRGLTGLIQTAYCFPFVSAVMLLDTIANPVKAAGFQNKPKGGTNGWVLLTVLLIFYQVPLSTPRFRSWPGYKVEREEEGGKVLTSYK